MGWQIEHEFHGRQLLMTKGIKAFSDDRYDYYELQQDMGGVVPKGAIFVHDTDDHVNGSPAEGCLKLCYTPKGNIYSGKDWGVCGGVCGGTVILHAAFTKSDMFKKVYYKEDMNEIESRFKKLEDAIQKLRDYIDR